MIRLLILSFFLTACSEIPLKPITTRTITIEESPNTNTICQSALGVAPYGRKYFGCASWVDTTCSIILTTDYNDWMLGHEVRHCFEGYTHP